MTSLAAEAGPRTASVSRRGGRASSSPGRSWLATLFVFVSDHKLHPNRRLNRAGSHSGLAVRRRVAGRTWSVPRLFGWATPPMLARESRKQHFCESTTKPREFVDPWAFSRTDTRTPGLRGRQRTRPSQDQAVLRHSPRPPLPAQPLRENLGSREGSYISASACRDQELHLAGDVGQFQPSQHRKPQRSGLAPI
jgi:hypothetical protein